MRQTITISALAKRTSVSSKALRYWESMGLLPHASRSHTGYRLFDSEATQWVEFIRKAKSIGLTLAEISKIMQLARSGRNPCLQVTKWAQEKLELLDQQIQFLLVLRRRLRRFQERSKKKLPCPPLPAEICCLIEDLPSPQSKKGGLTNEKAVVVPSRRIAHANG